MSIRDKTAIVGIGATEFSKNSGRSEMRLAVEAVTAALTDAGLMPDDVDGLATFTMDNNGMSEVGRAIGANSLTFVSRSDYGGGGACAPFLQAAMAISCGIADVVVCYRAMNERSGSRFGGPMLPAMPDSDNALITYHGIHGLTTAGALVAMSMRRYMYETGTKSEDFANVAIAARRHAANNPAAFFYRKPITLDDYMNSRMIADPLHLLDCCQESDGAVAIVVTSTKRARSLAQKPVLIRAAAQGDRRGGLLLNNYYDEDISHFEGVRATANQLYAQARITPRDVQMAVIYDHFVPTVFNNLEGYGFCARGEAKDFVKNGNIEIGGGLPVNTHGGLVGEAYIHGMNGVAEAVRQIRGSAINQVPAVENIVVTAASGCPTSGLILSSD